MDAIGSDLAVATLFRSISWRDEVHQALPAGSAQAAVPVHLQHSASWRRLTIATGVHLEDAPDDRRLFFDDFELHTADRKSSNIPPCNGRRLAGKMNPANSP
jgi:hypothetical protein